ncbi:hypothetical protein DNTS_028681 [Danionella cerebrum]|uniref:Uncharacterized protein n=1 Tax=Danionella cerebrum TaxID=2873325 RepID=A0A553RLH7_9TELE|nr:hypothetical protein DNTS_028681 [Danionella translucida]
MLVSFLMSIGNEKEIAAAVESISDLTDNMKISRKTMDSDQKEMHPQTPVLQKKCVNWGRVARAIDMIFCILYVITVFLFLVLLFNAWFR